MILWPAQVANCSTNTSQWEKHTLMSNAFSSWFLHLHIFVATLYSRYFRNVDLYTQGNVPITRNQLVFPYAEGWLHPSDCRCIDREDKNKIRFKSIFLKPKNNIFFKNVVWGIQEYKTHTKINTNIAGKLIHIIFFLILPPLFNKLPEPLLNIWICNPGVLHYAN